MFFFLELSGGNSYRNVVGGQWLSLEEVPADSQIKPSESAGTGFQY